MAAKTMLEDTLGDVVVGVIPRISDRDLDRVPLGRRIGAVAELWVPAGFLITMVLACFVWPQIYHLPNPVLGELTQPLRAPLTAGHVLGTDQLGNDVLSRILYGGRISIEVGLGTTSIGMLVGGTLGATAAFFGGLYEIVAMRCLEVLLSVPSLILAIIISTYFGPSELHVIWAISFFSIPAFARLSRANTLRLRERTFMSAARLSGSSGRRILIRHVVPNIVPSLLTFALLSVGVAIMIEAALSFLGLGVPPPAPSWGNMIAAGQVNLRAYPDLTLIPAVFLFSLVLSLNLLGDALRVRWGAE